MKKLLKLSCLLAALFFLAMPGALAQSVGQDPVTITPDPNMPGGRLFTTNGVGGRLYFGQTSTDCVTWTYLSPVKLGATGTPVYFGFIPTPGTRSYFRMKYTEDTGFTTAPADQDADGLSDQNEVTVYHTDPFLADTDGDGMPDGWEVQFGLNRLLNDSALDPDGDNLTSLQEYQAGTKPTGPGISSRDSDGDGLDDNVEIAAGGNPTKFDLPKLTLEYAWREANGLDTRVHDAVTARSVQGAASNGGGSRAWSMSPPTGTQEVNAVAAMNSIIGGPGTGATEFPYSEWMPWPGAVSAQYWQTIQGNGASTLSSLPVISHTFHRREIKVRLHASRAMPVAWRMHLRKVRSQMIGSPGSEWGTQAPEANPVELALAIGDQDAILTVSPTGIADQPHPGQPNSTFPTRDAVVEYSLVSLGTSVNPVIGGPDQDRDGDTLRDTLEEKLGSSSTTYSSSGSGVGDSDAKVAGVGSITTRLVGYSRSLTYNGTNTKGLTVFSISKGSPPPSKNDIITGWPVLNDFLGSALFSGTAPSGPAGFTALLSLIARAPGDPQLEAAGTSDSPPPPGSPAFCKHGKLEHRRLWAVLNPPSAVSTSRIFVKITRRQTGTGTEIVSGEKVTYNFIANEPVSFSYTDLLPLFQSSTGPETVKANLIQVGIEPDLNMAGVLGDLIPSSIPGSQIQHFVTPKKLTGTTDPPSLKGNYVILKATGFTAEQLTPGHAQQIAYWDTGAGEAVPSEPLKWRVKRDTAAKTEVKIKLKFSAATVAEMRVWVVWSTCTPTVGTIVTPPPSEIAFHYRTHGTQGWRFVFGIQPATIITDSERPALSGSSSRPVPGAGKSFATNPVLGDADTAQLKWDVSRKMSVSIRNSGLITPAEFGKYPPAWLLGQPVALATPVPMPVKDAEGNDDAIFINATTGDVEPDENADPYQASTAAGQVHAAGELSSFDSPGMSAVNSWGKTNGQLYAVKYNFQEFARLELWDGQRSTGDMWYRVSDLKAWHHGLVATFSIPPFKWIDAGSSAGLGAVTP